MEVRVPRSKVRGRKLSLAAERITGYVMAHWDTLRAAADALKVEHNTLWRTMTDNNANGPSITIVTALADHSGKSTDYFLGRGE